MKQQYVTKENLITVNFMKKDLIFGFTDHYYMGQLFTIEAWDYLQTIMSHSERQTSYHTFVDPITAANNENHFGSVILTKDGLR